MADCGDSEVPLPPTKIKRKYTCQECGLVTVNPRDHLRHRISVHGHKIKIVECPLCCYACQYRQKLNRHLKLVHKDLRNSANPGTGIRSTGSAMAAAGIRGLAVESTYSANQFEPMSHHRGSMSSTIPMTTESPSTGCSIQQMLANAATSALAGDQGALNFLLSSQLAAMFQPQILDDIATQQLQSRQPQQSPHMQRQQEMLSIDCADRQDEPMDLSISQHMN